MIANNVPDIDEMVSVMHENMTRKMSVDTEEEADFTTVMVPMTELNAPTEELKPQEVFYTIAGIITNNTLV